MRVTISETQYVHIIIKECGANNLNESRFDLERFGQLLYRGCKTAEDFIRRNKKAVAMGVSIAVIASIMSLCFNGSEEEKDDILNKTEEVTSERNSMLDKVYATDFRVSDNGLKHIKRYEKCSLVPYFATEKEKELNKRTIGWGHVITENDPMWLQKAKKITQKQADDLFRGDIATYENEVKELFEGQLKGAKRNASTYPQGTIDVCVSMMYNCGRGNFASCPFFKKLKLCKVDPQTGKILERDFYFTCKQIRRSCITQDGEVVPGLVARRERECIMAQH